MGLEGAPATGGEREIFVVVWISETARFFGFGHKAGGSVGPCSVAGWTVVPVEGAHCGDGEALGEERWFAWGVIGTQFKCEI